MEETKNNQIDYSELVKDVTKENFKQYFKRIMRQLDERIRKVNNNQRPISHYMNKRKEFVALIDKVIEQGWFEMPPKGRRIWRIYYDSWD